MLKQENDELKQENEEFKKAKVGRLIDLYDESNKDEDLNREKFFSRKKPGAFDSSHVNTSHEAAKGVTGAFSMDTLTYTNPKVRRKPSRILSFESCPGQYSDERDVQEYVGALLDDAVKYVNWALKENWVAGKTALAAKPEASPFSNKADHSMASIQPAIPASPPIREDNPDLADPIQASTPPTPVDCQQHIQQHDRRRVVDRINVFCVER